MNRRTITDYEVGKDKIVLNGAFVSSYQATSDYVELTLDNGHIIQVLGVGDGDGLTIVTTS